MSLLGRIQYRLWQLWQQLVVRPLDEQMYAEIETVLSPAQYKLFLQFGLSDQHHSYRVMKVLQGQGCEERPLLVAALLHDIGKTRVKLAVWERSLIVLAHAFTPQKMEAWGQGEAQGWKRPFVVKAQHPAWSAEMTAAIGTHPLAVSLIRRHQDTLPKTAETDEDKLLALLQAADDQN